MKWRYLGHFDFLNLIDLESLDLVLQDCCWHYSETDLSVLQQMLDTHLTSFDSLGLGFYCSKLDPNRLENYYYLNSVGMMQL